MKDTGQGSMVQLFLTSYEDFRVRLRRRLGSEDLANDVLHETYLRVDRMETPPNLLRPNAYLYRMALNIAADRRQADARLLTGEEVEELLQIGDEALDPARVVGGQKEIKAALGFCAAKLERKVFQRFGRGAGKPSSEQCPINSLRVCAFEHLSTDTCRAIGGRQSAQ